jgi:peptidyl-prolyl cis-trans isomerase SurA
MRILFFLLIAPFFANAQNSSENKTIENPKLLGTSELLIETPKDKARKLTESYRQRVINGETMSSIATLYSEDPGSAKNGGRYDSIPRGMMVPEFESVAFNLKPGEISNVFETKYGFHFIELIDRKGDLLNLRHLLVIPK